MAEVNYTRGVKLVVKVGDGASPEVFSPLCTINAERGITFGSQTNDVNIPDCDDPDKMAWLAREVQSLSIDVTGGGMSHKQDVKRLWDWFESGEAKNCQVILDDASPANVITWEGRFLLTQFDMTGNRAERVNSTMTLSSDGAVTATFGANVGGN